MIFKIKQILNLLSDKGSGKNYIYGFMKQQLMQAASFLHCMEPVTCHKLYGREAD